MLNILKIELWNGSSWSDTVYFTEDEHQRVSISYLNKFVEMKTTVYSSVMDLDNLHSQGAGNNLYQFDVTVKIVRYAVKTNLLKVIQWPYKKRIYYRYNNLPALYMDVISLPDYQIWTAYGHLESRAMTMTFLGGV